MGSMYGMSPPSPFFGLPVTYRGVKYRIINDPGPNLLEVAEELPDSEEPVPLLLIPYSTDQLIEELKAAAKLEIEKVRAAEKERLAQKEGAAEIHAGPGDAPESGELRIRPPSDRK